MCVQEYDIIQIIFLSQFYIQILHSKLYMKYNNNNNNNNNYQILIKFYCTLSINQIIEEAYCGVKKNKYLHDSRNKKH